MTREATDPQRPRPGNPYHHGALRGALMAAGRAELAERGIEAFSLRAVAKRAKVSHAAPAHHFGDVGGLLTALAADGFERLLATQERHKADAADTPQAQLLALGLGYVEFAVDHPALFRLMFASDRPQWSDPHLKRTADAAFDALVADVARRTGQVPAPSTAVLAAWSLAHGLADLIVSGRAPSLSALAPEERREACTAILREALRL